MAQRFAPTRLALALPLTVLLWPSGGLSTQGVQKFRGGVETVQVTVSVVDASGRPMTGLTKDDFEIFEDGDRQLTTQFTDARMPVSLGVLLDASDSMRGQPIVDAREAVDHFVAELLDPSDEAFIGTFNHWARLVSPWTRPPALLRDQL